MEENALGQPPFFFQFFFLNNKLKKKTIAFFSMIAQLVSEFIGTFFFLGVIIVAVQGISKNIVEKSHAYLRIGLALAVCIILVGSISGGHLNPAVSFMFFLHKELSMTDFIMYVIAQLLGATCALLFFKYLYETSLTQ